MLETVNTPRVDADDPRCPRAILTGPTIDPSAMPRVVLDGRTDTIGKRIGRVVDASGRLWSMHRDRFDSGEAPGAVARQSADWSPCWLVPMSADGTPRADYARVAPRWRIREAFERGALRAF